MNLGGFCSSRFFIYHSLFRGITCSVLQYLPPVPRAGTHAIASPILRCHFVPPCKGLLKSHPFGVNDLPVTDRNMTR